MTTDRLDTGEDAARFYAARDRRTMQYGATAAALTRPITLLLAPGLLRSPDGVAAARAMTDMLVRVHRQVRIVCSSAAAGAPSDTQAVADLHEAARAIDPFQSTERDPLQDEVVVYLAGRLSVPDELSADVVAVWSGGRGEVHVRGEAPAPANGTGPLLPLKDADHMLGACTAACLAAAATFGLVHGAEPCPAAVNILERSEGASATPASLSGPIHVGDLQVVGAGAVAHALAFWARELGVHGEWEFIDGDLAELHNANRCMGMSAASAGWPGGLPAGLAEFKAVSAAAMLGAAFETRWFNELDAGRVRRDLILVLANEKNVRAEVAALGEPLLLHATTSANWTAELHRHLAGVDDCPACRIPETVRPLPTCSAGPANPEDVTSGDAALPFLSAMAGLMLAVSLLDLSQGRELLRGRFNHWPLNLTLIGRLWQRVPHPNRCPHVQPAEVRDAIQSSEPRRWDFLDPS